MKQVSNYSHTKEEDETGFYEEWEIFELLLCPNCNKITIRKHKECSVWDDEGTYDELGKEYINYDYAREYKVIFPAQRETPVGLPPRVLREYKIAMESRNTDAGKFAMKSGRVLELIWIDFTAQLKEQGCKVNETETLDEKIGILTKYGIVPKNLNDVGRILKDFRNIEAHVEDYELSNEDLPILDDLLHAILLYVYTAPFIAKQAEERYDRLRGKSSKDISNSKAPKTS